ncbi:MAG TPA: hypothetical protein VI756_19525 [Blastocatellia bacterium]
MTVHHKRRLLIPGLLFGMLAIVMGISQDARAQAVVFGPQTFTRGSAAKDISTASFSVPDTTQPYTMTVTNGTGAEAVGKIWVTLNGQSVILPALLASRSQIMIAVQSQAENTISVKLKGGQAGSSITITIGPILSTLLTDPNAPGFDASEEGLGTPYGVAIDQQNHIAYVADRYWDSVVKFDLGSYSITQTFPNVGGVGVPAGDAGTTGLRFNAATGQLVAMNEGVTDNLGASIAVITPSTAAVEVTPLLLSGNIVHSDFLAVNPNNNVAAFGTLYSGGRVACFMDLSSGQMTTHTQIQDLSAPAVNPVTNQVVFAGINNKGEPDLVVFSALAPFNQIKLIASTAPAGTGFDKIAIDTAANVAIAVNQRDGSVSLFDLLAGTEVARLPITVGDVTYSAADVAVNTTSHFGVVTSTFTNQITIVDLSARVVAGAIVLPEGVRPLGVDIDQSSNRAVISENGLGSADRNGSILVVELPTPEGN